MATVDDQASGRKRRSDFEQNRETILHAANVAFVELGTGTSIDAIAKRAGVGAATVYRHFPSKEALTEAVFELRIAEYAAAIEEAQKESDPARAFRRTIHTIVELQSRDRSFRNILNARDVDPQSDPVFARFGAALLDSLTNARSADVLRAGVTDADVLLMLISTESIAWPTARESPPALERVVDLMLDGLCSERAELAGNPLNFDEVRNVNRS